MISIMRNKLFIFFVLLTLPVLTGCGQEHGISYEDVIKKNTLKEQVYFLASDELMGRNTGSEGIRIAAGYIADYFATLGVSEFEDAPGYLQKVPFRYVKPVEICEVKIGNRKLVNQKDFIHRSGGPLTVKAPVVYIGYGLVDTENDTSDLKNLDLEGKIVVADMGSGTPGGFNEIFGLSEKKKEMVYQLGGIAFIEIFNLNFPWDRMVSFMLRPSLELEETVDDTDEDQMTYLWLASDDTDLIGEIKAGAVKEAEINSSGLKVERIQDNNVVGYVKGTDPELKDEYVLLTAHYDHLGAGMTNGRGATPEDTIFNGAGDNVMGTVAIMGAAKAFAEHPAMRSVIFLAVTGEEKGLLGSRYFAEHPMVPLHQIIFNLNNDGGGMADTGYVNILGIKRTGAEEFITSACNQFGLEVNTDPLFEFLFNASDNVNFARKGIPAPTFSPGFKTFDQNTPKHYHRPSDEAETIDYSYYTKYVRAYVRAARNIANAPDAPTWVEGDEYEQAGKELYKLKE
jgi:hypothetical protein